MTDLKEKVYDRIKEFEWVEDNLTIDEDDEDACELKKVLKDMKKDKLLILLYMDEEEGYDKRSLEDKMDFINHMPNEHKHLMIKMARESDCNDMLRAVDSEAE